MGWISSLFSSWFSWTAFTRFMFPAPGRNMEVRYPVTCTVELDPISNPSELQPGDTVTVDGDSVLCRHVGVYLGNNEVIEFTNHLKRTTLTEFRGGAKPLSRVRYTAPSQKDEPGMIVERATNALMNQDVVGSYDVISNNSEHFVTYCTFGKRLSYEGIKAGKVDIETTRKTSYCPPCTIV
ncbi:hypothetical protein NP493_249g11068 [Ridgeia piscesae]|uniref:LRAT domain-containing protein n=1 Tax=Ridgeia piscesae TaxID=27915 RepID=A0AAD9UCZ4_RIDPI|nr:hypothetical protein NP493_249g11068 [Ridgeia piscesae]